MNLKNLRSAQTLELFIVLLHQTIIYSLSEELDIWSSGLNYCQSPIRQGETKDTICSSTLQVLSLGAVDASSHWPTRGCVGDLVQNSSSWCCLSYFIRGIGWIICLKASVVVVREGLKPRQAQHVVVSWL